MRMSADEIVRTIIAHRMQVAPASIDRRSDLQYDLGLSPLDLVLIALRAEEMTGIEFPIGRLEGVRIVADLTGIVRSIDAEVAERDDFTLDEPLDPGSVEADAPGPNSLPTSDPRRKHDDETLRDSRPRHDPCRMQQLERLDQCAPRRRRPRESVEPEH
jgi:acyl carrier protein